MADIVKSKDSTAADPAIRHMDMGDGSHAEVVVALLINGETPSPADTLNVQTEALDDGLLAFEGACTLKTLNIASTTVAGWFLLIDAASEPGTSVIPKRVWHLDANQSQHLTFDKAISLLSGCYIAFSTAATPFTRTGGSNTAFIAAEVIPAV